MPQEVKLLPEPVITVRLASGLQISATTLLIGATYENLLSMPNERHNERLLLSREKYYHAIWGPLPVHIVQPETFQLQQHRLSEDESPRVINLLPACVIAAVFQSRVKLDTHELVVVWYQSAANPLMSSEVRAKVEQLDWSSLAEEVEF
jgi:hypothetical protein